MHQTRELTREALTHLRRIGWLVLVLGFGACGGEIEEEWDAVLTRIPTSPPPSILSAIADPPRRALTARWGPLSRPGADLGE